MLQLNHRFRNEMQRHPADPEAIEAVPSARASKGLTRGSTATRMCGRPVANQAARFVKLVSACADMGFAVLRVLCILRHPAGNRPELDKGTGWHLHDFLHSREC